MIDTSEIKEITDFSKARKNPYAEKLRSNGYSIVINVSPDDIANMLELDPLEQKALEKYIEANKNHQE